MVDSAPRSRWFAQITVLMPAGLAISLRAFQRFFPQPAINASTRATMEKFGSLCESLPALILPQNSSISASG